MPTKSVEGTPRTIGWLNEDILTSNLGKGLWLDATSEVALELICRAVPLVAQGANRMNRDTHRAHFRDVDISAEFAAKVKSTVRLQLPICLKNRAILIIVSPSVKAPVDKQGCTTTRPHQAVEVVEEEYENESRVLEGGSDSLDQIIDDVQQLPDWTGLTNARATDDRLEHDFGELANEIPNMDSGPDMAHRGFITPDNPRTPYSNELGEKYGQANVFGKCEIHRVVLHNEVLRLRSLASTMLQRVADIEDEIKALDEDQTKAERWSAVADQAFSEFNEKQYVAFERRKQVAANRGNPVAAVRTSTVDPTAGNTASRGSNANEARPRGTVFEADGGVFNGGKRNYTAYTKGSTPPGHPSKRIALEDASKSNRSPSDTMCY